MINLKPNLLPGDTLTPYLFDNAVSLYGNWVWAKLHEYTDKGKPKYTLTQILNYGNLLKSGTALFNELRSIGLPVINVPADQIPEEHKRPVNYDEDEILVGNRDPLTGKMVYALQKSP